MPHQTPPPRPRPDLQQRSSSRLRRPCWRRSGGAVGGRGPEAPGGVDRDGRHPLAGPGARGGPPQRVAAPGHLPGDDRGHHHLAPAPRRRGPDRPGHLRAHQDPHLLCGVPAFGDPIPWLIALAFFFARGFIKTGLGNRVAYQFVSLFGSSSLRLGYILVFSEALLAPAIPSVSTRAGRIFLPLVKSLCEACGSRPGDGTERRLGAWLMLTCFLTSVISSSMFLTAMAANPLSANLTYNTIKQTIGWTDWAVAAVVPGLVSLVFLRLCFNPASSTPTRTLPS